MSQKPMNVGKKAQAAAELAFSLDPEDGGQRRSLTSVKDGGRLTKWANVAKFTIDTLEQGIKDSQNVGDSSLQTKLEEALAGFQELMDHYSNFTFLRSALTKKGYDFSDAFQACEEQLNQDRRRFAETVEQSRNVPQGVAPAGVPLVAGVQAVAGDGASLQNQLDAYKLKTAELEFKAAEVKLQMNEQIAEVKLETNEQISAMKVYTQGRLNKNEIAISDNKVAISEVQVEQQHLKVEQQHLKVGLTNANGRVDGLTNTVNGLTDTVKKMLLSNPVGSDEGNQLGRLVGDASYSPTPSRTAPAAATVDESDDNFDEVEVNNNIITPAPGQTSLASRLFPDDAAAAPVHADNYKAFLRHLKDARLYGQDGREVEMNSSLKKAEHIMLNTKLNEERNRWHTEFNNMSKCARRLCSQYGLKPAAC